MHICTHWNIIYTCPFIGDSVKYEVNMTSTQHVASAEALPSFWEGVHAGEGQTLNGLVDYVANNVYPWQDHKLGPKDIVVDGQKLRTSISVESMTNSPYHRSDPYVSVDISLDWMKTVDPGLKMGYVDSISTDLWDGIVLRIHHENGDGGTKYAVLESTELTTEVTEFKSVKERGQCKFGLVLSEQTMCFIFMHWNNTTEHSKWGARITNYIPSRTNLSEVLTVISVNMYTKDVCDDFNTLTCDQMEAQIAKMLTPMLRETEKYRNLRWKTPAIMLRGKQLATVMGNHRRLNRDSAFRHLPDSLVEQFARLLQTRMNMDQLCTVLLAYVEQGYDHCVQHSILNASIRDICLKCGRMCLD